MKRTRIDILVRTAVLPALILMMSLTGCSLVMDDDTRTPSDGKATLKRRGNSRHRHLLTHSRSNRNPR